MSANSKQIAGKHYVSKLQHWDMLVAIGYGPEYYIGQATKYIYRWRKKNGLVDLRKGLHFVEKLAELIEAYGDRFLPRYVRSVDDTMYALRDFFQTNDVEPTERGFIETVVTAGDARTLHSLADSMEKYIQAEAESAAHPIISFTQGFTFVKYTEDDKIRWRENLSGLTLDLPLNVPPMQGDWQ